MTLRKITIDNRVKYIKRIEQIHSISRDINPSAMTNYSLPRKENKKSLKIIQQEKDLDYLKE